MKTLDKLRNKLVLAAYSILFFIAVVCCLLAAFFFTDDTAKTISYGIGSNCIFTILVYTVLTLFMADPNEVIKDRIAEGNKDLIEKINTVEKNVTEKMQTIIDVSNSESYEKKEYPALSHFFLGIKDKEITHLDMVGYCMTHIFEHHDIDLDELLKNGVKIRVMIIDPNSSAGNFMKSHVKQGPQYGDPHVRSVERIKTINKDQTDEGRNNLIQFMTMDWVPCGAILMGYNDTDFFSLLFGINGFSLETINDRRLYILETTKSKSEKFTFLSKHYEELWTLTETRNKNEKK